MQQNIILVEKSAINKAVLTEDKLRASLGMEGNETLIMHNLLNNLYDLYFLI